MAREPEFVVDLRQPARREMVVTRFLRLGVCPVEDQPFPGLLVDVVLLVVLPDEHLLTRRGRVVQRLTSSAFAVQLHEPITDADLAERPPDATAGAFPFDTGTPDWARSTQPPAFPEVQAAAPQPTTGRTAAPAPVAPIARAPSPLSRPVAAPPPISPDVEARLRDMPLPEKQQLAREGSRAERQALMRDANKALHAAVLANPAVDLDEVIEYSSVPGLSGEALAAMAHNKAWIASRSLVMNLVQNPSTPPEIAARLVPRLGPNEWRALVGPGAARPSVAAQARKLLSQGD